jgi:uncharacterized membrane protein YoaK (UPF0700 family)
MPLLPPEFGHEPSGAQQTSARNNHLLSVHVLAPMWISFIFGAFTGAVIVSSFHSIGLGIVVPLILLAYAASGRTCQSNSTLWYFRR